ncbi:hypothetical protein PG985_001490 [Apiospora marii]|uniref:uncharacterized protein n=1 Tax=Apiospora marii TaxID=335849 RepID=UPI0031319A7C
MAYEDENSCGAVANMFRSYPRGMTSSRQEERDDGTIRVQPMIWLDVTPMRVLLERDPEPADASVARFDLAGTILHELAHAIFRARRPYYELDEFAAEPYMGEEQIRELGLSFASHIFEGVPVGTSLPQVGPGKVCGREMTVATRDFPSAASFQGYEQQPRDGWHYTPYGQQQKDAPVWLVPPAFCSAVFEQNYWDNVVSKDGTNALKHARFRAWNGAITSIQTRDDTFRNRLRKISGALKKRKLEVEERSPISPDDRAIWSNSLWSYVSMRSDIALFRRYHCRQDLRLCREVAQSRIYVARVRLETLQATKEKNDTEQDANWICIAIASLPAEHLESGDTYNNKPPSLWRNPQNEAHVFEDDYGRAWDAKHYEVESADGYTAEELTHPSQYLEVAEKQIFTQLSAAQSLHAPWIEACQQSFAELRRLRGPGSDPLSWAEFGLQIPVFELDVGFVSRSAPSWLPKPQGPQPRYKRVERFLAPSDIADDGLVLVRTANAPGWSCYDVPPRL